jgi:hypothetical protein
MTLTNITMVLTTTSVSNVYNFYSTNSSSFVITTFSNNANIASGGTYAMFYSMSNISNTMALTTMALTYAFNSISYVYTIGYNLTQCNFTIASLTIATPSQFYYIA